MRTIAKRLIDGQDLMTEIIKVAEDNQIKAGIIISAVGSLKESNIRVPVINGEVKYINLANLEIDNLHGTISMNGIHLHISVSDVEGLVMGGHLKEGCIVRTTCELVIGILEDTEFSRETDESTGFNELIVR